MLVEEIKNNIWQPNFAILVLTLYCYCGDNVSKKFVPRKATTWWLRKPQSYNKLL